MSPCELQVEAGKGNSGNHTLPPPPQPQPPPTLPHGPPPGLSSLTSRMRSTDFAGALGAVAVLATTVASLSIPRGVGGLACASGFCPRSDGVAQLGASLSAGAQIVFPGSAEFTSRTTRWSNLSPPKFNAVVVPGSQEDVVATIKFANERKLPFLATNTAHGTITTLGKMDHGIEIDIQSLNSVEIATDGKTARVGGGIRSKELIDALWAANKQTVTGTCECVSIMGPALGGGHGWLQGYYGLVADNMVSLDVVLADGRAVTASADQNADLFYALKGAGHNFGVVTSAVFKIYDVISRDWAIETHIFSGGKVEAVYRAANEHLLKNGTQSRDLINWSYWLNDASMDPKNPIIIFYIIQQGVKAVSPEYTQPFHDIGPLVAIPKTGDYPQVSGWAGVSLSSPPCQKAGLANPRFPIYLDAYDPATMAEAYAAYAAAVGPADSPFHSSIFMFEGYPSQGLRAVDASSTAFAHRDRNLLNAPLIQYNPASGADVEVRARELGGRLRDMLQAGSGRAGKAAAYVNYGYGNEEEGQFYGDAARVEKLAALKDKYDPSDRFSFYAPISHKGGKPCKHK
ncbi:hypothetical protein RB600_006807 [Gaeumannomyces tritici]